MKDSQLALINGQALTEQDVMVAIDTVLEELNNTDNIERADHVLQILNRIENTTGLAKAKLLYGFHEWWRLSKQDEKRNDTFWDYIEVKDQQKKTYAKRLITVWKYQDDLPKQLRARPVKDQIPVCQALRQEYDFTKGDWDDLIKASSNGEILDIVRRVKGKPARKSSMQIKMERDGTINAWMGNKKHFVGFLNIKEAQTDEVIGTAIERILHNTGITEK